MSLSSGTRAGPYRILEPLGAGGMGEVYRARDERLGRDVAVKILPAEVAADPDRLRRFEQEARAAGQLAHPNILVVYDVGTHEGQPFLVTELLEGETLRAILDWARLPVRKAIELGAQAAQGLAAAHERGIVHRDLKPENIFLTRDGVVKLLDFGLAKVITPQVDVAGTSAAPGPTQNETTTGVVLGTVGYMAPEQARGLPTDHRTDLFALGCVLHEMVTGKRAFTGASTADIISAILTQDPPAMSGVVEHVPPALEAIVRRCLEKRPEDRFQSARDLAFDLASLLTSGVVPRPAGTRLRVRPWIVATTALVVVALATTAFLLWSPWRARPPAAALDSKRVVIAPFENRTSDAALDAFGVLVPEALVQGASGIGDFAVVPAPATTVPRGVVGGDSATGAQALRQLAQETGAGVIVTGAYYLLGEDLRIQSQLTDAASGKVIHTAPAVTGPRTAQTEVVEKLRQRVLGAVAAHFDPLLSSGLMHWPLLDAYLEFQRASETGGGSQQVTQRRHLQRALDLDPDFFFPAYGLHWQYLNAWQCDDAAAVLQRFQERVGALTSYERNLYEEGRAYEHKGGLTEALRLMRARIAMTPDQPGVRFTSGIYELFVRLPRESATTLKALSSENVVTPSFWQTWYFLAHAYHRLGEYGEELAVARQGGRRYSDVLELRAREVAALAALGQLAEADRTVDAASTTPAQVGSPGMFLVMSAVELRAHGLKERAQRLAERAADWYGARPAAEQANERPVHLLALALAGRWQEAKPVAEALPDSHTQWDILTLFWGQPAVYRLGWMGSIAARLGDQSRARRIAAQLRDFQSSCPPSHRTYWRAAIAAQLGATDEAMRLFQEAVAQESRMIWQADHDVLLEPLWTDPRFGALVRPYQTRQ